MRANPLTGPPPQEVPLPNAPIVRVIAQVRFPIVAAIEQLDFIAPFQEAIRGEYAVLRQDLAQKVTVTVMGQPAVDMQSSNVWRFQDVEHRFQLTLATDFLALETSAYVSRADFFDRFERLLEALQHHIRPGALDRVGVRYIDRLTDGALSNLAALIEPALLGTFGTSVGAHATISVSESLFELPDEGGQLRARWGVIPPHATLDPTAIEPIDARSWVLDIDTFVQGERAFHSDQVALQARGLAQRAYAFFRWSVTDEFIEHFGGTP